MLTMLATPRFLVADDVPWLAEMQAALLQEAGAEVAATAFDGSEALEQFRRVAPDACLLDFSMPGLDGLQVLRAIRAHEGPRDVAARTLVVILTSSTEPAIRDECLASGADHFLCKPVEPDRLQGLVEEACRRVLHAGRADALAAGAAHDQVNGLAPGRPGSIAGLS